MLWDWESRVTVDVLLKGFPSMSAGYDGYMNTVSSLCWAPSIQLEQSGNDRKQVLDNTQQRVIKEPEDWDVRGSMMMWGRLRRGHRNAYHAYPRPVRCLSGCPRPKSGSDTRVTVWQHHCRPQRVNDTLMQAPPKRRKDDKEEKRRHGKGNG